MLEMAYELSPAELKIKENRQRRRALARDQKAAAEKGQAKAILLAATTCVSQAALHVASEQLQSIGVAVEFDKTRIIAQNPDYEDEVPDHLPVYPCRAEACGIEAVRNSKPGPPLTTRSISTPSFACSIT